MVPIKVFTVNLLVMISAVMVWIRDITRGSHSLCERLRGPFAEKGSQTPLDSLSELLWVSGIYLRGVFGHG